MPVAQVGPMTCRWGLVRLERMIIEAGDNTFTLSLHPRLTVVAGLGSVGREALIGELLGALGSSRSGVHLELVEDEGRRLAVFRPEGARPRVVDIDASSDVSAEFTDADGRLDVLARHGLDLRSARRTIRLDQQDLLATAHSDDMIRRLAELDQTELWSTAARVRVTDDELQTLAQEVGSVPEDAEIIERIEDRHQAVEVALDQHRRLRRRATRVCAAALALAVPTTLFDPKMALMILGIGMITILLAFLYRARVDQAAAAERSALNDAGAQSYLGFVVQRVDGLLSNSEQRRRLLAVAEDHRAAARCWTAVAGDVSVDWALEHHEEVVAAAKLRSDMASLGTMSSTAPEMDNDSMTDLAHALITRLAHLRTLGTTGESFPLILDEPFGEVEPTMKPGLLELLSRSAGSPQVLVLTDDEDVASWARLEALTGVLAIVEPQPEAEQHPARAVHAPESASLTA
ncbi:MAG: hypothetical protein JWN46_1777 [Acidimicrobiales bacterium]|nr:hypothetical protein [Acidimicrobiales bacterium]